MAHFEHDRSLQRLRIQGHHTRHKLSRRGKTRELLVVAKSLPEASKIADATILGAMFEDSGPEILARARKLGIKDNDAGIDDGTAS